VQLAVQPISPQPGGVVTTVKGKALEVSVQVTLSCGMPACAGGRWDPRRFRVRACLLPADAGAENCSILSYSGRVSEFAGRIACPGPGRYQLLIEASDPETGAAGRLNLEFSVKTA